jgi:hypothetical protein
MAELPSVQRLASYSRARTVRVTRADLRRMHQLQIIILALQLVNITATLWRWAP